MGAASDGALRGGGTVDAVILDKFLDDNCHPGLRHVRTANNMPQRKMGLYESGDAYVAVPGGLGTMEEILEILSWRQLGFHERPVIFLNTNGYWTTLVEFLNQSIDRGFVSVPVRSSFYVANTPEEVVAFLKEYKPTRIDKSAIYKGDIGSDWSAAAKHDARQK
eukprot:Hpha_TRINITY_DN28265_c0_g1::TRINITY_DN28265_c0_g1_i1::g.116857::m.116857/K06966/K06966; uncharacterized protein